MACINIERRISRCINRSNSLSLPASVWHVADRLNLRKTAASFQHASSLFKHIAPHGWVRCGNAGKITEADEKRITSFFNLFQINSCAHNVWHQCGNAGNRQRTVMIICCHLFVVALTRSIFFQPPLFLYLPHLAKSAIAPQTGKPAAGPENSVPAKGWRNKMACRAQGLWYHE